MAKLANVEEGAVYEGYDNLFASEWCTPSFLGCSVCVAASAVKGQVTLTIGLKTPFGNVSKSFSFNTNVSYTWQPFSRFKITVSITNFNEAGGVFSFDLGLNPCIDVPFVGWKCFNYSHHFSVPLALNGIENNIDDTQFASIIALHAGNAFDSSCGCDDKGSSLLQGDIYNNFLRSQGAAGFPTIPITQCLPIPTVQCIPTITSCVTGISPICSAQQDASNLGAGFPTIPITQCLPIPTVQCIPTVTSCVTGISPICSAQQEANVGAGFPTIPITQCFPIPTVKCIPTVTSCVTGVSPICLAQQDANAGAGFPTIPITQCLPIPTVKCIPTITSCVTGISPICLAQQGGNNVGAGFPTIPVTQCFPIPTVKCIPTVTSCITGISPICSAQQGGNNLGAGIIPTETPFLCPPTLPVSCAPTLPTSCFPTLTPTCFPRPTQPVLCPPTATGPCNTSPVICRYTNQGGSEGVNAAAVPTLPVDQCVPTVSCIPTISCIPTVSCTGIPFIC